MFLLCGLGNKGTEYAFTRHNAGYLVVERYAERLGIPFGRKVKNCRIASSRDVVLAKPDTYMNLSGGPVAALLRNLGLDASALVVIHDDLDMDFGRIRLKWNGGDGGHKGVRSVGEALGSKEFHRLKLGIGRHPFLPPDQYVLQRFTSDEAGELGSILDRAADAVQALITDGSGKAMSLFNRDG